MSERTKQWLSSLLVLPLIFTVRVGKQYLLPTSNNVEKLEMIRVVGVDQEKDGVHLLLAAATAQDEGTESNFLIEGKGKTFYEAVEDAQKEANKSLFWGHADIMVLGKETAEGDISKYIDFLSRDSKTRLSMKLLVVKNGRADDLLKRKGSEDQSIYEGLSEQLRNLRDLSYASEVRMSDVIDSSGDAQSSYLIPMAEMTGENGYEISGAAVLREGRVVRFLDAKESRAANLVRGDFHRGLDTLEETPLGCVSLEADDGRVRIEFDETDEGVTANVYVTIIGTLAEQFSDESVGNFDTQTMQSVGELWAQKIHYEIAALAETDETRDEDVLGIREKLYHHRPLLFEKIQNGGKLDICVYVDVNMSRVHVLDREI